MPLDIHGLMKIKYVKAGAKIDDPEIKILINETREQVKEYCLNKKC